MTSWFHTAILATVIAATAAVGLAAAAIINSDNAAPKADRLPVVADAADYVTIETRHDGISVLQRVEVN